MIGTVGNVTKVDVADRFCIKNVALIKPRQVTGDYLLHLLRSDYFSMTIQSKLAGGIQKFISLGMLRSLYISIMSDHEQNKISETLSDIDLLITTLEKLIEKKKLIKQGVMQELLTGKRRLPGFSGECETKRLGDVADLYQPETISSDKLTQYGYTVWGANGIIGCFDQYNHEDWQVIVTCRGSTCGKVNRTDSKCWITGNSMVINVDDSTLIDKMFLYYSLHSVDLSSLVSGSGQPQIVRKPLQNVLVSFPSLSEQSAISEALSEFDNEVASLKKQLRKMCLFKQAMMQELLTGRIRLV